MKNNPDASVVAELSNSDTDLDEYAGKTNEEDDNMGISEK